MERERAKMIKLSREYIKINIGNFCISVGGNCMSVDPRSISDKKDEVNYDWMHLLDTYKNYCNKDMTTLEIGASSIGRTVQLSHLCKKVIGVEYFSERLHKDFSNIIYKHGDWARLSEIIEPNSIDIIVSSHTLEHIPEDLLAINQLFLVLKKNGIAIISTPNRKRLIRYILEIFTGNRKFPHGEHQREYSKFDLVKLLNKSKFSNWEITPVVFGLHAGKVYCYLKESTKVI